MQFLIGRLCHDTIHEVEELASPSFLIMAGMYQSGSHFQGSKQGNSAMTFILMIKSPNGLTILKAQPALCSFLSLNGGLLIHAENQGIFRWVQIERDDVRCFLGKLRIGTQTPTMTTLKVNAMFIKYLPDLIEDTSPKALATNLPVQLLYPGGGGLSNCARIRFSVVLPYFGVGPGLGIS